ncbi:nicotinamidase isoform X1 [Centruroides vittatus]|uniref:nicotinamidase isoform X1 n=2 Tax=Centruroides vittatus TaxID=120091 RepID=UPI0035108316
MTDISNYFSSLLNEDINGEDVEHNCYRRFAKNTDQGLNLKEFEELTRHLFCNKNGQSYSVLPRMLADMFYIFDANKDGRIDKEEFKYAWKNWIKVILKPVSALIVIDVQNDFIKGSLSIKNCPANHNGEDIIPVINHLIDSIDFNVIIYSLDWHPDDHVSFIENISKRKVDCSSLVTGEKAKTFDTVIFEGTPKIEQKLWPKHCVQNTWGAEFHPDLKITENAVIVHKGTNSNIDSYSAFWDNQKLSSTNLDTELRDRGVTDVFICGLAYDYCVGSTTLHALELGYRTFLVDDASRGVDNKTIKIMKDKIIDMKGIIINSDQIRNLIEGKDRRPELGYRTAMLLARK